MPTEDQEPEGNSPAENKAPQKDKEAAPIVPPSNSPPNAPITINGDAAEKEKNYRLNRWQFIVSIVTLIVLATYTAIAAYQSCLMRRATTATQIAANADKDSITLQTQIIKGTQAAELMPGVLELPRNTLHISVVNKGGIKPTKVVGEIELTRLHLPENYALGKTVHFDLSTNDELMPQKSYEKFFVIPGYHAKDRQEI